MNLMTHNNLSFRDFFQTKILVTLSIRNDIVHLIISNPFINDAQIYSQNFINRKELSFHILFKSIR